MKAAYTSVIAALAAFSAVSVAASAIRRPNRFIVEFAHEQGTAEFDAAVKEFERNIDPSTVQIKNRYSIFPGVYVQVNSGGGGSSDHGSEGSGNSSGNTRSTSMIAAALRGISGVKTLHHVSAYRTPQVPFIRLPEQPLTAARSQQQLQRVLETGTSSATQPASKPMLLSAHNMTGVNIVHDTLGYDGTGIKVGVLDTGVDYTHPALGGCFGPGCRVRYGYDFIGDTFASPSNPVKKPGPDPQDRCSSGHGTHVSGIIAAIDNKYGLRGVSPGVILGAYKVFSCAENEESTDDDVIISAMEGAHKDGMDIINMSLGGATGWENGVSGRAASLITRAGTIVVAAAGNSGDGGLWEVGEPSMGRDALSVASYDNTGMFFTKSFKISSDPNRRFGHDKPANANATGGWQNVPIVELVDSNGLKEACGPITMDVRGKIALIKRGNCTFAEKAKAAINTGGAAGVIFYNHQTGIVSPALGEDKFTPAIYMITKDDGEQIARDIAAAKDAGTVATISDTTDTVSRPLESGGKVSDFSSYGPGTMLEAKPDVGAPGGSIFSLLPLRMGTGYASMSGTSMATPYAAGSLALVMQVQAKKQSFREYFDRLISTASPHKRFSNDTKEATGVETVARQGGGLVNVLDALTTRTTVVPSRLALNDSVAGGPRKDRVYKITVRNDHTEPLSYRITHQPAESAAPFAPPTTDEEVAAAAGTKYAFLSKPAFSASSAAVTISPSMITVPPKGHKEVELQFTDPYGLPPDQFFIFSGYIEIAPQNAGTFQFPTANGRDKYLASHNPIHVPYTGLAGNYHNFPILDPSPAGVSVLFDIAGNKTIRANETDPAKPPVFSMVGNYTLGINTRLIHPTRMFKLRVLDASKNGGGKSLGFVADGGLQEYTARCENNAKSFYFAQEWNGRVIQNIEEEDGREVPNGEYQIRVEVLKPFGNIDKEEDYETLLLPKVQIARPYRPSGSH
ncbi:subtilisin-like protein [Ramicandelaber brevisporus]|nr:subtilisin-like protein [Ramicandelaber brevisporus]